MKRKLLRKVLVNWAASFLSVALLLSMAAAPALAYVAANQVVSSSIVDNSILNRDIKPNVISSSRIKDNTVLNRDIAANVISSSRIRNGTIRNSDIANDAAIADSKIKYATKTGYLTIPVPALTPNYSGYDYVQESAVLYFNTGKGAFYAPIQLPHGAMLKKFYFTAFDNHAAYAGAKIIRSSNSNPNPNHYELASITTKTGRTNIAEWLQRATSTIASPKIDNKAFSYTVEVYLGGPSLSLAAGPIVIEYTYATPGG